VEFDDMKALPKIVRQRLRSGAKPGGHPQADLLTGFAEKTLTERERTRVVEHLARCEDCREVVFLAAPHEEPSQVVQKIPGHTGWLSWPALRWGAAVACVVVVGTAVTLLHQDHGRQALSERADSEKAPSAVVAPSAASSSNRIASAELKLAPPSRKEKDAEVDKLAARIEPPAQPSRKAMSAVPKIPMEFDSSRRINGDEAGTGSSVGGLVSNAPAAPSPNLTAKTADLGGSTGSLQKQSAASRDRVNQPTANEALVVQSAAAGIAESEVDGKDSLTSADRALTSAQASPARADSMSGSLYAKKELARASIVTPRWMLTPEGILQRSFNGGKSWEDIPVADKISFQTFAAIASEVWAGGADGLLYHSSDAGLHWTRVTPQTNGESLTAGITGIQFSDIQNGKVTTANGETWTTSDAGKTWQKN
jgi:Photosynthesis system II assembly factor YCF48/Putative zinc-finger